MFSLFALSETLVVDVVLIAEVMIRSTVVLVGTLTILLLLRNGSARRRSLVVTTALLVLMVTLGLALAGVEGFWKGPRIVLPGGAPIEQAGDDQAGDDQRDAGVDLHDGASALAGMAAAALGTATGETESQVRSSLFSQDGDELADDCFNGSGLFADWQMRDFAVAVDMGSTDASESAARASATSAITAGPLAGRASETTTAAAQVGTSSGLASLWPGWLRLVIGLWLVFALAWLGRLLHGVLKLRKVSARATQATEDMVALQSQVTPHGTRAPRLLLSEEVAVPMTWGVGFGRRQPVVLLPQAALAWTPERLRVVLLHETGHVARRDWLVRVFSGAVRCLYWWHPLVHWAYRRLELEQELACDEWVARRILPSTYARHLLDLHTELATRSRPLVAALPMLSKTKLERRMMNLLDPRMLRKSAGWPAVVASLCFVFLVAAIQPEVVKREVLPLELAAEGEAELAAPPEAWRTDDLAALAPVPLAPVPLAAEPATRPAIAPKTGLVPRPSSALRPSLVEPARALPGAVFGLAPLETAPRASLAPRLYSAPPTGLPPRVSAPQVAPMPALAPLPDDVQSPRTPPGAAVAPFPRPSVLPLSLTPQVAPRLAAVAPMPSMFPGTAIRPSGLVAPRLATSPMPEMLAGELSEEEREERADRIAELRAELERLQKDSELHRRELQAKAELLHRESRQRAREIERALGERHSQAREQERELREHYEKALAERERVLRRERSNASREDRERAEKVRARVQEQMRDVHEHQEQVREKIQRDMELAMREAEQMREQHRREFSVQEEKVREEAHRHRRELAERSRELAMEQERLHRQTAEVRARTDERRARLHRELEAEGRAAEMRSRRSGARTVPRAPDAPRYFPGGPSPDVTAALERVIRQEAQSLRLSDAEVERAVREVGDVLGTRHRTHVRNGQREGRSFVVGNPAEVRDRLETAWQERLGERAGTAAEGELRSAIRRLAYEVLEIKLDH